MSCLQSSALNKFQSSYGVETNYEISLLNYLKLNLDRVSDVQNAKAKIYRVFYEMKGSNQ